MKRSSAAATYTETISVRLTSLEAERLNLLASKGHRTISQTVRMLLEMVLSPSHPVASCRASP